MTVLLVLFFFTTFLLIDHFRSRHAIQPVMQVAVAAPIAKGEAAPRIQPALVAVPGPGKPPLSSRPHLGIERESKPGSGWPGRLCFEADWQSGSNYVAATRPVDSPGTEDVHHSSRRCAVDMVSPIEGRVSDINQAIDRQSETRAARSLRRRLVGNGASARRQDEFPQPAGWGAGSLVDRRVSKPPAAPHAAGLGGRAGAGRWSCSRQPHRRRFRIRNGCRWRKSSSCHKE